MGHKLYQGIKANRTTDDTPSRAKSKGNETLFLQRRDCRHDVGRKKASKEGKGRKYLWIGNNVLLGQDDMFNINVMFRSPR